MAAGDLITGLWQVEWRGTLLGWPATELTITNLTGWLDMPPMRSSPIDRPGRHGAFASDLRASYRTIEVDFADVGDDPTAFRNLISVTAPGEDDGQEPLVVYVDGAPQMAFGRCEKRAIPTDRDWSNGYRRAMLQWSCPDPRRYSVAQHTMSLALPTPASGGLVFPLVFPLNFGTGLSVGQISPVNAGSVTTYPVFTIVGPVTGPIVINTTTGQQLIFDPAFTVASGQTLVIDTDARTVLLNGVSRRSSLITAQWFGLPHGATNLQFTSVGAYDPAALLSVAWRDADM